MLRVPRDCGLLSERELNITEQHDAVAIVEKIRDGVFTVEDVVTAFCKRAAIVQQVTNCLTEIMFAEAIATARTMDEERQRNPTKPLPPLYGLPISLKDGFKIPGFDATMGFVSLVDQPATTYSALPALLKDLGAVFYCQTNVPQTLMSADSYNNVFGRTLNPYNTAMTPGGSSGGEAALIAMRGSILGLCTDIAGSVRIPAVCNGIYGFKACASIIPYAGQQSPASPGIPGIIPSIGPLATSSRACAFLLENAMKAEAWRYDGTVLHLPWQDWQAKSSQPLRIGLIEDNAMHTPSPPIRRALRESAEKLRRAGHELVPISLEDLNITQTVDENGEMYGLDGSQMANKLLSASGEPVVPSVIKAALLDRPAKILPEIMSLNDWSLEASSAKSGHSITSTSLCSLLARIRRSRSPTGIVSAIHRCSTIWTGRRRCCPWGL